MIPTDIPKIRRPKTVSSVDHYMELSIEVNGKKDKEYVIKAELFKSHRLFLVKLTGALLLVLILDLSILKLLNEKGHFVLIISALWTIWRAFFPYRDVIFVNIESRYIRNDYFETIWVDNGSTTFQRRDKKFPWYFKIQRRYMYFLKFEQQAYLKCNTDELRLFPRHHHNETYKHSKAKKCYLHSEVRRLIEQLLDIKIKVENK